AELDSGGDHLLYGEADAASDLVLGEVERGVLERVDDDGVDVEALREVREGAWRLGQVERQRAAPDDEPVAERIEVAVGDHPSERSRRLPRAVGGDVEKPAAGRGDVEAEERPSADADACERQLLHERRLADAVG